MELDAIDPRRLRSLVERAIRKHMPKKRYDELMAQEERERQQIWKLVDELDIEERTRRDHEDHRRHRQG